MTGSPLPRTDPSDAAVDLRLVSKRFPLFGRRRDRLWGLLGRGHRLAAKVALQDVSLAVNPGEAVGIIGANGSGKTTLLRIVAGTTRPDTGTVEALPPVAAILELGLGFHPAFTGRENALLYGALIGVSEQVMRDRLPEVLAFAELGDAIDQPLRTYSSGMTARLAFAVATHVEPRVLVVDEALAVGDAAFQKKCVDRMVRFKNEGRAILFCSHSSYLVTSFCNRAVWLRNGRVEAVGGAREVVEAYEEYLLAAAESSAPRPSVPAGDAGPGTPVGRGVRVLDGSGAALGALGPGSGIVIEMTVVSTSGVPFHLGVLLEALDGRCVIAAGTHWDGLAASSGAGEMAMRCVIPRLDLGNGHYSLTAILLDETGLVFFDQRRMEGSLVVSGGRWNPGLLAAAHTWERA